MHNDVMDIVVVGAANMPVGAGADPAWVHKPSYQLDSMELRKRKVKREERRK